MGNSNSIARRARLPIYTNTGYGPRVTASPVESSIPNAIAVDGASQINGQPTIVKVTTSTPDFAKISKFGV